LFVKLTGTGADGLIPVRTLGSEYYNYDEARHALIGSRSGAMHRLGDVVQVRLVEAAPVAGALRFELLSEGSIAPRGGRIRDSRKTKPHAGGKTRPGRDKKDGKKKSRKPSGSKARKPKKG
jgi:ribonuclease R